MYFIVQAAKNVLEKTPPELSADIIDRGVFLTGGGALFMVLINYLAEELKVPVFVSENPLDCVAIGTGILLENIKQNKSVNKIIKGVESMFRGFHTAASGMIAQQRKTEMLTNNIANANTPGFKAEQSSIRSFPEMFMANINKTHIPTEHGFTMNGLSPLGPISTGVYMQETLPLLTQGQLLETELTTDIALIDGNLPVNEETGLSSSIFFTLENDEGGELYTRNGNFALDAVVF